ncbi:uncharacterized protein CMU_013550 [Cryptosporidium muris RN66]|uniref:EGF-like domain-containing protein n=1 Tax=Cryptosporidium muris (strain RN66) TaxID=441375 RepID=B6AER3_CRYMR|nr:uncharacterized protein CMU_013550 [Cryptosporidium muris RN66]EEA06680.1 hypothetical protein CMU_013550 [Cryptosporidium muris RN66]|eukprot:XP_002141029.1 hypothetical protein [Cryptosporidium muris RN66]
MKSNHRAISISTLVILLPMLVTSASFICSSVTQSYTILTYCKNGSKCLIETIGGNGINTQIKCICNFGYGLPDCSLEIPGAISTDIENETKNTCWLEDLLQVNQEYNNFALYKHIFNG